ncbi:MAG: DUF433 domain-containing protein [Alphaproteobacteria bacterium]|nr:DUF433 domain-containing protein [Alphaproteobacteria bacterium]
MNMSVAARTYSANEAACVTGVPVKQVHRIIDAGLLEGAAPSVKRARALHRDGLVGLKLAHETADVLTRDGRRRLVRYLLDHPDASTARAHDISVDLRSMRKQVRDGLARLAKARAAVSCDETVLSGTPCIKGTRIPVHDIADMLANGDSADAVRKAFPQLLDDRVELAALYARAYPRRGRPRRLPFRETRKPTISAVLSLDELPPARGSS